MTQLIKSLSMKIVRADKVFFFPLARTRDESRKSLEIVYESTL